MGRILLPFLFVLAGCYMSHEIGDPIGDAGPRAHGNCRPGETQLQACGRCGTATRSCQPDMTWGPVGECTGETEHCGVDMMLLADITGSHTSFFQASETTLTTDLIEPLERDADMRVGIAAFADYPYSPYGSVSVAGSGGDHPFVGVLHPTHDVAAVDAAIATIMFLGGADGPEAEIAGLDELSGGTPHLTAVPFMCTADEVRGGCWRARAAWHVIVVMTDTASHNLPGPDGHLVSPYGPFRDVDGRAAPPAPSWETVRSQLVADGTYVYWIVPDGDSSSTSGEGTSASAQARELATELGEDPDEAVVTYAAGSADASTAVRVLRVTIATHFGIRIGP